MEPNAVEPESIQFVAYCRISNDKAGAGLAVQRQEKEIHDWAKANGHTIAEVLVDNDISAYSGKPRPGFERLLKHENKNVVVWHQDRLLRVLTDLQRVIDAKLNVYQVTAGGKLDLTTPQGKLHASVTASMATYEVELKTQRQLAKNRQLAETGKYRGSIRPFGNDREGNLVEPEATAVRDAVKSLLAVGQEHRTFYGISKLWNDAGLKTPQTGNQGGKQWTSGTVRQYFQRPRLHGHQEYKGKLYALSNWTALITQEEFDAVQVYIQNNSAKHRGGIRSAIRHDIHLLTGILRCTIIDTDNETGQESPCDRGLNVAYRGGKYNTKAYKCPTSGHLTIVARSVEHFISQHALQLLSQDAEMHENSNRIESDSLKLRKQRTELVTARDKWVTEAIEAKLPPALIAQFEANHTKELEELDAQLAVLDQDMMLSLFDTRQPASARRKVPLKSDKSVDWGKAIATAPNVELTGWNQASIEARRELLQALFSKITVKRREQGSRADVSESIRFEYTEFGERLYKAWAIEEYPDYCPN